MGKSLIVILRIGVIVRPEKCKREKATNEFSLVGANVEMYLE